MFVSKKFGSCVPPTDRILIEVKTIYGGFFNHLDYFSLSMLLDLEGTRGMLLLDNVVGLFVKHCGCLFYEKKDSSLINFLVYWI